MAGRGRGAALTVPAWMKDSATVARRAPAAASGPAAAAAAVASGWARATAANGRHYWYSRATGETTWTDPGASAATVAVGDGGAAGSWARVVGADGRAYYFDKESRATRWDPPPGFAEDAVPGAPSVGAGKVAIGAVQQIKAVAASGNAAGGAVKPVSPAAAAAAAAPLPSGWVAYKTPEGKEYFHCAALSKTVWQRPGDAVRPAADVPARPAAPAAAAAVAVPVREGIGAPPALAMLPVKRDRPAPSAPAPAVAAPAAASGAAPPAKRRRTRTRAPPRGYVARPKDKDGVRYLRDREAEVYFLGRARKERERKAEVERRARAAKGKGPRGEVGAREVRRLERGRRSRDASEYVHVRKAPEETAWGARERFEALMRESGVTKDSSWLETMARCTPDERYEVDIQSYGHRKQAYANYVAKLARAACEAGEAARANVEDDFMALLDESFAAESPAVMTLAECNPAAVARCEADPRYTAFGGDVARASAVREYFHDRDRSARERRLLERRRLQARLRAQLDAVTEPSLRRRRPSVPPGQDGAEEAPAPALARLLTDRSTLAEAEGRVADTPEFKELAAKERTAVILAWMDDVKRAAEDAVRAARREFVEGVREAAAAGLVSFRAAWPDVAKAVGEMPFAKPAIEKGFLTSAALPALFDDGMQLFFGQVDARSDAFRAALRAADGGFCLSDATTVEALRRVPSFAAVLDGVPDGLAGALLYERRKKEVHRQAAAVSEFEDLLRRRDVDATTDWPALRATIVERTAYKQLCALAGGEDGAEAVFRGMVERRERRRKRDREVGPRAGNGGAPAAGRGSAGNGSGASVRKRPKLVPALAPPPPPKRDEDTGWAAAISSKDARAGGDARREERERRKKEILAAGDSGRSLGKPE
jgi:hypothetical protein